MPNLHALATSCVCLEPRPFPPPALPGLSGLSVTPRRPAYPSRASGWPSLTTPPGLPVLRALPLCTCCRHYPGTATGGTNLLIHPVVSAFPGMAARSACASSFSRLARRSLALGLHTRAVTVCRDTLTRRLQPFRYLLDCSGCFRLERLPGGACTHWKNAAFSRCTPEADFVGH